MKILHAPENIVNIPYLLSCEFRKMGHVSDVMSLKADHREFNASDYTLFNEDENKYQSYLKYISFAAKAIMKYDTFLFHWRNTLLPREYDIPVLRRLRKRYYIYHHGRDVYWNTNYYKHVPHARWAEKLFVSTPDLYDFTPDNAIIIPQAINLNYLNRFIRKERSLKDGIKEPVIITHAIGNGGVARERKGSDFIIEAVDKLKNRGFKIDFRFFIGERHEKVLREIARADIHLDQVVLGWYGTITAEAMAMGCPVMCYIRPDLEKYAEKLPLFRLYKGNLEKQIEKFIMDFPFRKELSEKGKAYVKKTHDAPVVAHRILSHFNS